MKEKDCENCNFCEWDEATNTNICTINGNCKEDKNENKRTLH